VKTALTEHYTKNYKDFLGRARKVLGDYHYAEDCVQEAFENALRYSHTFNQGSDLASWFNRVFLNTVFNYLAFIRSQGVVTELTIKDHPEFPSELVQKYEGVITEEILNYSADPQVFDLLLAYFIKGHSAKAVAALSGTTESTVYNISHRFRRHLEAKYLV
jgi:RNA polymerase sigma factor (sigma-70 family)